MVKNRTPYEPKRIGNPTLTKARKERFLRQQAKELGYVLTPAQP